MKPKGKAASVDVNKALAELQKRRVCDLASKDDAPLNIMRRFGVEVGRPTGIVAPGGVGKTWLAMDLALAIASESDHCWGTDGLAGSAQWGADIGGRVLHLDFEMGRRKLKKRYQRLARCRGIDLAALERDGKLELYCFPNFKLDDVHARVMLERLCEGFTLVIIDNWRAALGEADENASSSRRYLDMLSELSDRLNVIFAVLFHEPKPLKEAGPAAKRYGAIRGSSAVRDALGALIEVSEEITEQGGEKIVTLRVESNKIDSARSAKGLHIELQDVGDLDSTWWVTEGVRIVAVDEEARRAQKEAEVRAAKEASHLERVEALVVRIVKLVKERPGQLGTKELRGLLGAKAELVTAAVAEAEQRGLVQRTGKPGTKQPLWPAGAVPNGSHETGSLVPTGSQPVPRALPESV